MELYTLKETKAPIYCKEGDIFKRCDCGTELSEITGEASFIYATEGKPEYTLFISLADNTLIGISLSDASEEAYEVISALGKAPEAGIDFLKPVTIRPLTEGYEIYAYNKEGERVRLLPAQNFPVERIKSDLVVSYAIAYNKAIDLKF